MATNFSNVSGSNNVTMPLLMRVRQRLVELQKIGKDQFQKGEDREWNNIPASMPIEGSLHFDKVVKKISDDEFHVKYNTYKTKMMNGVPVVVRKLQKVGPGDMGIEIHQLDKKVTEIFKKGKFFEKIEEDIEQTSIPSIVHDKAWQDDQTMLKHGGLSSDPNAKNKKSEE